MGKVVKLVMVTSENNNKFYHMTDNENGTFTVVYGRVQGGKPAEKTYPIREWEKTYRAKTKKGYKDVTTLFIESIGATATDVKTGKKKTITQIANAKIKLFFDRLQAFAKKTVEENYTISQSDVTQQQVDAAQGIINTISAGLSTLTVNDINNLFLELYSIIPRKMKHVSYHLLPKDFDLKDTKNKTLFDMMDKEQKLLDTMAGQVEMLKKQKLAENGGEEDDADEKVDTLKMLGLEMVEITDAEVQKIKSLMGPNAKQFVRAFGVKNIQTEERFIKHVDSAKNKKIQTFWHGSRNENWLNILQTGLLIRPSGAVYSGSMFGDGIYGADKAQKSIGYTSLSGSYWARGSAATAFLALFDFHVGNQKHVTRSNYGLNKKNLAADGFDSVFAEGGADLRNNEYIIYDISQATIRYIIEISN